jgi:hypothetical protein
LFWNAVLMALIKTPETKGQSHDLGSYHLVPKNDPSFLVGEDAQTRLGVGTATTVPHQAWYLSPDVLYKDAMKEQRNKRKKIATK